MSENLKKFAAIISENKDLQEKIKSLNEDEELIKSFIINESKNYNITISNADFDNSNEELSKDEMAAIAGSGACACLFVGGGGGSGMVCACPWKAGTGFVDGYSGISSQGGCICYKAGAGATRRH